MMSIMLILQTEVLQSQSFQMLMQTLPNEHDLFNMKHDDVDHAILVVRNLFLYCPLATAEMSLCPFPRVRLENSVALFFFSPLNMASSNIACHAELRKTLATRYSDDRPVSKANAEIFWTQLGKRKERTKCRSTHDGRVAA
jgi:hypothetical protein